MKLPTITSLVLVALQMGALALPSHYGGGGLDKRDKPARCLPQPSPSTSPIESSTTSSPTSIPTDPCADHVLNYVVYRLLIKCTSVSSEDFSTARAIMRSIQDTGLCYGGMASDMFACHVNVSFDPAQLDDFLAVPNVTGYELI